MTHQAFLILAVFFITLIGQLRCEKIIEGCICIPHNEESNHQSSKFERNVLQPPDLSPKMESATPSLNDQDDFFAISSAEVPGEPPGGAMRRPSFFFFFTGPRMHQESAAPSLIPPTGSDD